MAALKTTMYATAILPLAFAALTALDAGEFGDVDTHIPQGCSAIAGVQGPEDIVLHPDGDTLLISSDARREERGVPGALYVYKLQSQRLQRFEPVLPQGFRPHGISLYPTSSGALLYIVNHAAVADTVEVFRYIDDELRHMRTIHMNGIKSLNDIVGVSENSFYVTEDHALAAPWRRFADDLLRVPSGRVLYYDGTKVQVVASDIAYANGIATDAAAAHIFVAAMTGKKILVFQRDPSSGALVAQREIALPGAPDNIAVDALDRLLVAVHPKLLTLKWSSLYAGALSPSKILRVATKATVKSSVETLYAESGALISSASVGVVSAEELIIGSVFDDHFLVCPRGSMV